MTFLTCWNDRASLVGMENLTEAVRERVAAHWQALTPKGKILTAGLGSFFALVFLHYLLFQPVKSPEQIAQETRVEALIEAAFNGSAVEKQIANADLRELVQEAPLTPEERASLMAAFAAFIELMQKTMFNPSSKNLAALEAAEQDIKEAAKDALIN